MLYAALGSFIIAALFGAIMLFQWTQKKRPASILVIAKGAFVAIGLGCLVTQAIAEGEYPQAALIFFILALLGGAFLLYSDLVKQHVPLAVGVIHGLLGITAIVLLLLYLA